MPEEPSNDTIPTAAEIVVSILDDIGDLPRLMELYYFWREPDLFEIFRWLSTVTEDELQRVTDFLHDVPEGSTVHVERSNATTLVLKLTTNS